MNGEGKLWRGTGPNLLGFGSVLGLVAVLGVWGTQTQITGAVLAIGQLQVETKRQVIQHPDGGIVAAINVANGDVVDEGQTLISLDAADTNTEIEILKREIAEMLARSARLRAERDGLDSIEGPADGANVEVAAAFKTQARLFASRLASHRNELDQMAEVVKQTTKQVQGVIAQRRAVEDQIAIVAVEVARQSELEGKNLALGRNVASVRTQEAELRGRAGSLTAEVGRLNSQIAQIEIERGRLEVARQEIAIEELADIALNLLGLQSRLRAAERQLSRLEITSPVAGIVFDLQINAVKSVIGTGEELMYIVPQDEELIVTARVSESDIDQLKFQQEVNLRFSALDTRFTPTILGRVERISADILIDQATGHQFYEVEIRPVRADLVHLGDQKLLPGMPVEAFIKTGDRTPLEYLVKPLADYFYRAFRGA